MQLFVRSLVVGAALAGAAPAFAQLDNLAEQLRTTPITTQKIADNFHVLFGVGGNIIVSIGSNGTLIVDGQFPQMVPKYKAKIGELGGGKRSEEHTSELQSLTNPLCRLLLATK